MRNKLKVILPAALIALAVVGVVSALEITNTTHFFHKQPVPPHTASEYTKGEPLTSPTTKGSRSQSSTGQTTPSPTKSSEITEEKALEQPSGNFVSSHKVALGKGGLEASACNTTPGATCTITFTKDGNTKSLPSTQADAGGAAYWSWNPQKEGLTPGSWKIQAVARLGNQTLTADDSLMLDISE